MDIGKFKNNGWYFDDSYVIGKEVILSIQEAPEYNLHIDEMYFREIFGDPIPTGEIWIGFTRDYQEEKGAWEDKTEIKDVDEYIWDMLRYKDKKFDWKETPEVFNLILDFLTYAKETGQTVIMEMD